MGRDSYNFKIVFFGEGNDSIGMQRFHRAWFVHGNSSVIITRNYGREEGGNENKIVKSTYVGKKKKEIERGLRE